MMDPLRLYRWCFSWRRMLCLFFLTFVSSGFAPRWKEKEEFMFRKAKSAEERFNFSNLTPLELKDRSMGLQIMSSIGNNSHFTLEGQKFLIFGGSIHYFRVPREYWRDRLLKLKACGFNTVTTYIPWNLHEPERGKFDFSGNLDLETFVLMAEEVGLWVILRPGPYICGEIDLGGLPSWLLQNPDMRLRTTEKNFVSAVDEYFDHLVPRLVPLQYQRGGPVIALQVENEYGFFGRDITYMPHLQEALQKRGVVEMLLTSDNEKELLKGSIKGVLATINIKKVHKDVFKLLKKLQPEKPIFIMEYWVGWFDTWGAEHSVKDVEEIENAVSTFFTFEISFNVYMFHGGTNFGFINGAINFGMHRGVVTSYDYDAVLTEAGDYTEKFFRLRKLFTNVLAPPLPPIPKSTHKTGYPPVCPSFYLPLWDVLKYLGEPVKSKVPLSMENLPINNGSGQSYGFVLYETSICTGGQLHVSVHDVAQVFLNDSPIGYLDDSLNSLYIPFMKECQLLRILVENQGRVNYSWDMHKERKGITGPVTINNTFLQEFTIYSLEMKTSFFNRLHSVSWNPIKGKYIGPAFYLGTLKVGSFPKDTFLSLPGWKCGFVFINGHNLGRYWIIGPQKTLYLPGVWLHPEDNEIIVFEKFMSGTEILTAQRPILFKTIS
ncbi:beta-galactosidase-1-like protein 3 [Erinaceus europaeus]|uniref:Beta-galactosidase n=1 Tax=Erinaceus europaeus TaxID=9365 RepID=A0ABM3WF77_ERIEU|nr:beta-galactosidase-1-like protein 3 [Erinaceus europaeus]